jgi:MFS transporter, AAHS family, benzoate transport protein
VVLLPVTLRLLPESPSYAAELPEAPPSGMSLVLRPPYLVITALFCGMTACSFLLIFGMNTWLPQLMRAAHYPVSSSLTSLVLLNVGATVGGFALAAIADRAGSSGPVIACFVVAVAAIATLGFTSSQASVFVILLVGGAVVFGVQGLINVYISSIYPVHARATAIGVALGIGRIGAIAGPAFGGGILAAGLAPQWNFVLFAVPALAGAALAIANRPAVSRWRQTEVAPLAGGTSGPLV